jgi:hypothetical protein
MYGSTEARQKNCEVHRLRFLLGASGDAFTVFRFWNGWCDCLDLLYGQLVRGVCRVVAELLQLSHLWPKIDQ